MPATKPNHTMRIPEAELIINQDGSVFHLHIKPEELADNVILVGDPGRVGLYTDYLTDVEYMKQSREFSSVTGKFNGERVTVLSTGIGCDNIDIVMNELDALANIDFETREVKPVHRTLNILRIGTSGAIQPDIPIGSYILSHYSIGCDGLINWYADRDNYSDYKMEEAFKKHLNWNKHLPDPYFAKASDVLIKKFEDCTVKGMTISAAGFYGPQGRVLRIPLAMPDMLEKFESFKYGQYRITNFEMEGSAIAALAAHLGHNGATICCAIANRYLQSSKTNYSESIKELVKLSLDRLTR